MNKIYLKDYKKPHFFVEEVFLDVVIEDYTYVTSKLKIVRNKEYEETFPLVLDGENIELLEVELDGNKLNESEYSKTDKNLTIETDKDELTIQTKVKIDPENNLSCEGLYKSGSIYCTQNEPEGFRKFTYYIDRSDVMAKFTTKITADKTKHPILLSNGNNIEKGDLEDNKHYVVWNDPHLKPSYLFALVAGDLGVAKDTFTTKSNRVVKIEFFVDKGNENRCGHAIKSLKNAMKWDEEKFGLEYDLDIYMVVAVDSFNFGAMENKGLNVFNSGYVLANSKTATDNDFQSIEGVIGHEYFHNWTGNRVTCRDWFQLTLKEGLTVFRDEEFSSDMLSRPVKRIEDVKILREYQFAEDKSPMSHPIKPKSYMTINNFYTSTVYNKGAEVIRMIETIIGKENFRKGIDLYFERHDGSAVTTEDFVSAMADASKIDLEQFKVWYDQNGTPKLTITSNYDEDKKEFSFTIEQSTTLNNDDYDALHIPLVYGLISKDGQEIKLDEGNIIHLKKPKETFVIKDIKEKPIPSWNRNFSAPVNVEYDYSDEELATLMSFDSDNFNRYEATQNYSKKELLKLVKTLQEGESIEVDDILTDLFKSSFKNLITDKNIKEASSSKTYVIDEAFLAYSLELPSINVLNSELKIYDFDNVSKARKLFREAIGKAFNSEFNEIYSKLNIKKEFDLETKSMGQRSLKNVSLAYIVFSGQTDAKNIALNLYENADNMTEEISSLKLLNYLGGETGENALLSFYNKWKDETLIMQKWLTIQAMEEKENIMEILSNLEKSDVYDPKVPNLFRSLVIGFAALNPVQFNDISGSGYKFVADKIIEVDKFNPHMAANLSKKLNHLDKLDLVRQKLLKVELTRILDSNPSKNTTEIIRTNLGLD